MLLSAVHAAIPHLRSVSSGVFCVSEAYQLVVVFEWWTGVLFSIEVTSTYFLTQNYWKSFFCAVCGAFVLHLVGYAGTDARQR